MIVRGVAALVVVMATGAVLLRQLRARQAAGAAQPTNDSAGDASAPAPACPELRQEDEWITAVDGRRVRIRDGQVARVRIPTYSTADGSAGSSLDDEALVQRASARHLADKPAEPANADDAATAANASIDELTLAASEPSGLFEGGSAAAEAGWALVRQHNVGDACWIVVGSRVLDCTAYLGHHPGGRLVIERLAGKDASKAYRSARHSRAADLKLHDFDVGAIGDVPRLARAAKQAAAYRARLAESAKWLE